MFDYPLKPEDFKEEDVIYNILRVTLDYHEFELQSKGADLLPGVIKMNREWTGGWKIYHHHETEGNSPQSTFKKIHSAHCLIVSDSHAQSRFISTVPSPPYHPPRQGLPSSSCGALTDRSPSSSGFTGRSGITGRSGNKPAYNANGTPIPTPTPAAIASMWLGDNDETEDDDVDSGDDVGEDDDEVDNGPVVLLVAACAGVISKLILLKL
ncbi:hypothetical protein MMC30_001581 [Trapelia coarctata]|nr:hypothetical protein [Trapelia coarctata]